MRVTHTSLRTSPVETEKQFLRLVLAYHRKSLIFVYRRHYNRANSAAAMK